MDQGTYKAARRAIVVNGLKVIADGLYGLRMTAIEEEYLESMMLDDDNCIDFEPEDEDEQTSD